MPRRLLVTNESGVNETLWAERCKREKKQFVTFLISSSEQRLGKEFWMHELQTLRATRHRVRNLSADYRWEVHREPRTYVSQLPSVSALAHLANGTPTSGTTYTRPRASSQGRHVSSGQAVNVTQRQLSIGDPCLLAEDPLGRLRAYAHSQLLLIPQPLDPIPHRAATISFNNTSVSEMRRRTEFQLSQWDPQSCRTAFCRQQAETREQQAHKNAKEQLCKLLAQVSSHKRYPIDRMSTPE